MKITSQQKKSGMLQRQGNLSRTRVEEIFFPLLFLEPSSCVHNTSNLSQIAKKIIKGKFISALYPEDFQGAAPSGDAIILLSSDEDELMDSLSLTSVFNLQLPSEGGKRRRD